jgi:ABC-type bacteriocin/lantibiotic exporter with double-glycine peptidase domain
MAHPSRRTRFGTLAVSMVIAAAACGCYHGSAQDISRTTLTRERGWMLVKPEVNLVRQTSDNQCGAAALAMVLQRWAVPASEEEIVRAIPVEKGHGIAAGALRDFARQRGLQAYVIKGELADLLKEVNANRPVMVGLVQRYSDRARAHYEVVAGINPTSRSILLLDPGRGLRQDGFEGFAAEWEAAGRMALVVLPS